MPHKTFTHKDLAKQLGVSETTIKSYRRKFPGCIPLYSQGKPIRFNHEALAVCKKIRDLFEQGMSIDEVRSRLVLEFSWIEPAEKQASASEELKQGSVNISDATLLSAGGEQGKGEAVNLPQSFTTAISGLAKSVVALTRQQSVILERLTGLEEKITPGVLNNMQPQSAQTPAELDFSADHALQNKNVKTDSLNPDFLINPSWADDLASRLEGMEQVLVRTLASFEGQFNSLQEWMEDENLGSSPASDTKQSFGFAGQLDRSAQPTRLGQPGQPMQPMQPAQPAQPGQPGQPAQPGQPGQKWQAGKFGESVQGWQSAQTAQTGQIGQTGQAAQIVQTGQQDQTLSPDRASFSSKVPAQGEYSGLQSEKLGGASSSQPNNPTTNFRTYEDGQELFTPAKDMEKGRVLPWNDKEGGAQKIIYKPQTSVAVTRLEQVGQKEYTDDLSQSSQHSQPSPSALPGQGSSASFAAQQDQGRGQACKPAPPVQTTSHGQERYSEEFLRHISGLPLAVSVSGDFVSLSGRGPFSLNDLKAILAQTFSPPDHYVGKWETASGECWYILEQPEVEDGDGIRLHLRPVLNRRNVQMLELVRFMVAGVYEHPSSLYSFVQEWLG